MADLWELHHHDAMPPGGEPSKGYVVANKNVRGTTTYPYGIRVFKTGWTQLRGTHPIMDRIPSGQLAHVLLSLGVHAKDAREAQRFAVGVEKTDRSRARGRWR